MKTRERRLQALETQHRGPEGFELWIGDDAGGEMLGPNGETMSRAAFDERYPDAIDIGGTGGRDEAA